MAHEVDFSVRGESMQYVDVDLDPGETVVAEAGGMLYMTDGIRFETRMGDGAKSGVMSSLWGAARRMLTSESLFLTHFTNEAEAKETVAFAAPYPGQIVPIDLAAHSGEVLCQKDAFLCAAKGTEIAIAFSRRLGAGLFGGEGFVLQRLKGDGHAFVHAGGTVVERVLSGERLRVDTGCLVAFEAGVDYDIAMAGGLKSMMFGGEGMFLATLSGQGKVWLQSLPFSRLADRIIENAPALSGSRKGEGD
jgi:uncharacterized protein (TIGR00266 family)